MKTSWKTTLAGMITAIGTYLVTVTEPSWVHTVGTILSGAGPFFIGLFARDHNISSEQAGIK